MDSCFHGADTLQTMREACAAGTMQTESVDGRFATVCLRCGQRRSLTETELKKLRPNRRIFYPLESVAVALPGPEPVGSMNVFFTESHGGVVTREIGPIPLTISLYGQSRDSLDEPLKFTLEELAAQFDKPLRAGPYFPKES